MILQSSANFQIHTPLRPSTLKGSRNFLSHSNHEGYVWHKCGPDDEEVLHEK